MWDNIKVFIIGLFVASLCLPFVGGSVYADKPQDELQLGDRIILDNGTETIFLGRGVGGVYRFMTTIDAPSYIPGTITEVRSNWAYDHAKDEWFSEDNLFDATVKQEKVTIWKDGWKMHWDPKVSVGGKNYKAVTPYPTLLLKDPINENYYGNTLEWDYGVCKRHLRMIEGMLFEYFIFDTNPGGDVEIKSNLYKDSNFTWSIPPFAYDAEGNPIEIEVIGKDKVVRASEFNRKDVIYPITIDPTSTFTTSSSDGYQYSNSTDWTAGAWSTIWSADHDVGTAYSTADTYTLLVLWTSGNYWAPASEYLADIGRCFVFFDTSGLPNDCEIDSAVLKLYGESVPDTDLGAWNLIIQSGMPTYPSDPLAAPDFLYSHYSGNGGTLASGSMGTGYKEITLSATGEGWIDPTGVTKFILREKEHDADDSTPSTPTAHEENSWRVYSYEKGDGYRPQLVVTYSAAEVPTITALAATEMSKTTAIVHSYLNDDGGEPCEIKFFYDTDSGLPYANNTTWLSTNYTTGQSPETTLTSLTQEETYYFIAQAQNSAGSTNSTELSFQTLASLNPPTNFIAIPRSHDEISVKWEKGEGSQRTRIQIKVGDFPSSTTDGDNVYFGTRNSVLIDDSLIPGTTYYLKAWGEDGGNYSSINITDIATTFAGVVPGDGFVDTPATPGGYWDLDYTNLANWPFYDRFNEVADSISMQRTQFWLWLSLGIAVVFAFTAGVMTGNPIMGLAGGMFGIGGAVLTMGAWWMMLIFGILGFSIGYLYFRQRGAA